MLKKQIRSEMLKQRKKLTPLAVNEKSEVISQKVFNNIDFQCAGTVCVYISSNNEVSTYSIIKKALDMGKRVCAPKVNVETLTMEMMEFVFFEDLVKGAYGILEPIAGRIIPPEEIDLILVPGVAFTKDNHRIGYGAGYYDKYLVKIADGVKKIGLAFDFQMVDCFDTDETDVALDCVITD